MAVAFLSGRFLFGGYFIYNGLNHFLSNAMLTQFAVAKGVPSPSLAVAVAGLLILFGGISILLGWRPELGIGAIVLFLVVVSFPMHNFWAEADPALRMADMVNFTKNMALVGATLIMALCLGRGHTVSRRGGQSGHKQSEPAKGSIRLDHAIRR